MSFPIKIISGSQLMKRWNMSSIELFFMLLNHKISPAIEIDSFDTNLIYVDNSGILDFKRETQWARLEDQFDWYPLTREEEDDWELTFYGDLYQRGNIRISDFVFWFPDVLALEAQYEGKKLRSEKVITGNELMKRWGIDNIQLKEMRKKSFLSAVDPLGHPIKHSDILEKFIFLGQPKRSENELLYNLTDIKDFESKHPEIIPEQPEGKKPEKKKRPSQIHKQQCIDVAKKLWEKDPTITIAAMGKMPEMLEVSKRTDGTYYLEKTIHNWIKGECPNNRPGRRPKKK